MPCVPHSGEANGKTWDSRLVREMPATGDDERERGREEQGAKVREKRLARASDAEEKIITQGEARKEYGGCGGKRLDTRT